MRCARLRVFRFAGRRMQALAGGWKRPQGWTKLACVHAAMHSMHVSLPSRS